MTMDKAIKSKQCNATINRVEELIVIVEKRNKITPIKISPGRISLLGPYLSKILPIKGAIIPLISVPGNKSKI
ncbi:hypothetical protein WMW72_09620 [Paenibacillus filicis]|uniref:Uncharacterized protein n=1 Tax=Paenibacillus filicis TaxID=669464 RepID=A0ABU9DJB5_9BACL